MYQTSQSVLQLRLFSLLITIKLSLLISDNLKKLEMMLLGTMMMKIRRSQLIQNHFQRLQHQRHQLSKNLRMEMMLLLKKKQKKQMTTKRKVLMRLSQRKKRKKKNLMMKNKRNCRNNLMMLTQRPKRLSKATLIIQRISNLITWKITKAVFLKKPWLQNKKKQHSLSLRKLDL